MLMTTDGKMFVYVLMGHDGCECESMEAIFASRESAESRKAEIQKAAITYHSTAAKQFKNGDCYGDPDLLKVEMHEVKP